MQKFHSKTVVQTVALAAIGVATAVVAYRKYKAIKEKKPKVPGVLLDWSYTPRQIRNHAADIIRRWQALDDAIASTPASSATFENTFGAFIALGLELDPLENAITFPKHVSTEPEVREAALEAEKDLCAFGVESSMRKDVYYVLKKVAASLQNASSSSKALGLLLSDEERRYVAKSLQAYEQNGMHLEPEAMKHVEAMKKELSNLEVTFSSNIAADATTHLVSPSELAGCSDAFVESLDKDAATGKLVLTMSYPHVFTVSKSCTCAATRQAMEAKFNSRCIQENAPLLEQITALRHRIAQALGHETHAHYRLATRMSKSPDKVLSFLADMNAKLGPVAEAELMELKALKAAREGGGKAEDQTIHMWDYRYYLNALEEAKYQVDHEALREYFPFDTVLEGMLSIYRDAFGLQFTELKDTETWHPDVMVYQVNEESGVLLGYFYLDLWPRPNKFSHAACWPLQPACTVPGQSERQPCVTALVCNFPPPGADGKPPLLEHSEVVTFFHEFGHGVHNLCSKTSLARFAGTATERDFVEAPSQMLENWCWDKQALARCSKHHQTGEPIPEKLVDALVAAKHANVGLLTCRQLFFGMFDQTIHSQEKSDTAAILADLHIKVMRVPMSPGTNFGASFGHMCGYDAQYYGYMWSEVFSDDLFQSAFRANPMSRAAGRKYCDLVLAPGGSKDAADLLESFLGRPPSLDAFLTAKGLRPGPL